MPYCFSPANCFVISRLTYICINLIILQKCAQARCTTTHEHLKTHWSTLKHKLTCEFVVFIENEQFKANQQSNARAAVEKRNRYPNFIRCSLSYHSHEELS